jgi:membrane-associated HD superfamily phosphohydrolase
MKNFALLNKQIEKWRRIYQHLLPKLLFISSHRSQHNSGLIHPIAPLDFTKRNKLPSSRKRRQRNSLIILIVAIVSFTSVVGYRFYNQPQLAVGKESPERIEAPRDAQFEDIGTTEQKRREVRQGIVPILKQNKELTLQIQNRLTKELQEIGQLRNLARPFPFTSEKIFS